MERSGRKREDGKIGSKREKARQRIPKQQPTFTEAAGLGLGANAVRRSVKCRDRPSEEKGWFSRSF